MAIEYQQPVITQGGGLTNLTVNSGSAPDAYGAPHVFQKTSLHYRAWIAVQAFNAKFTFFSDDAGTGLGEITLLAGQIYDIELGMYGGKIKNAVAASVATYEIWWMQ